MDSLGIIEVAANTAAIQALDAMCKAAAVNLVAIRRTLGGRLVSIIIEGSVSDVQTALEAGNAAASKLGKVAAMVAINNPHQELVKLMDKARLKIQG